MECYLEDYRVIKIITNNSNYQDIKMTNPHISLKLIHQDYLDQQYHLIYEASQDLLPYQDYYLMNNGEACHLSLGKITRSKDFDKKNYYDGPLGVEYHHEYSIFRLWSPVLKEAYLHILNKDYKMLYFNNHWEIKIVGDLEGLGYYYHVRINEDFFDSLDPYAVSGSLNKSINYVIDAKKTYQMKHAYQFSKSLDDAIIYELHLKDLTYPSIQSNYLDAKLYANYFADLGITHIQIMPVNNFYGIDEEYVDAFYNWGYNPLEYMNLSGWYATKPMDAYNKINEFKNLIDHYHSKNLGIIIDMVFNHVYKDSLFSYGKLVPGYCFRCDERGFLTDGSMCGNDLSTASLMIRRLIIDTCLYFVEFYKIDGIRFDLMGLMDIDTLNKIQEEVHKINPHFLLYGEGWVMNTGLDRMLLGNYQNYKQIPSYAFFNGEYRDLLVGNQFLNSLGFLEGDNQSLEQLFKAIKGELVLYPSINYLECHDNYSFNDYLELHNIQDLNIKKDYLKLGLGLLMISKGTPFLHLGLEFGRSKKGHNNTYNLGMDINQIDKNNIASYQDVIDYLKTMINFRKTYLLNRDILNNDYQIITKDHYLHFTLNHQHFIISNNYQKIVYQDIIINKPGVYLFNK